MNKKTILAAAYVLLVVAMAIKGNPLPLIYSIMGVGGLTIGDKLSKSPQSVVDKYGPPILLVAILFSYLSGGVFCVGALSEIVESIL